ncbi:hypothetical protein BHE74_00002712 [Ensete ventricosum]|uniref:Uncharacterized protein n=1 Tax=Ensete ventricosum TaxID=4639 RepID=A0A444GGX9_ENSVE|nr:hypothetical protein B296_00013846 [Ensete ventricosum]RWW34127.1 hypothetical protein GW17_00001113 [Ensete ventricosum]RWW88409.1 hypothetical protein BHE74_00002712 [Ensete ventricosum]RZR97528.1 hypothetical protein BHM03_00026737 [Ensete ventricosum]
MLWRRGEAKRRAHWYLLKDAFTTSPTNPMWDVRLLFLRSLRETAPCPLPRAIGVGVGNVAGDDSDDGGCPRLLRRVGWGSPPVPAQTGTTRPPTLLESAGPTA